MTCHNNKFLSLYRKKTYDRAFIQKIYPSYSQTSEPITTDVVSSNLDQGEVYNIM